LELAASSVHESCARGVGGDGIDVGDRGEMNDGVAPLHRAIERRAIEEIAHDQLDVVVDVRRANQVEDPRLETPCSQPVDDVGTDESGAAGYKDDHFEIGSFLPADGR
jgi:hypothetical protein